MFKIINKISLLFLISCLIYSQENTYRIPSEEIVELIDAPPTPRVTLSPYNKYLLIQERSNLASISEIAQPEVGLAGLLINPNTNGQNRQRYYIGLTLVDISTGINVSINGLPEDPKIKDIIWSPNGNFISFTNTTDTEIELWIIDVENNLSNKIPNIKINDLGSISWISDTLLACTVVPEERGNIPQKQLIPTGPVIQENITATAPLRTYQNLLKNVYDEELFKYYINSQIALVSVQGKSELIGEKNMILYIDPSPNEKYLLITIIHEPFSYLVPYYRFPFREEIWDLEGSVLKVIADIPLAEEIPLGYSATREGIRQLSWRNDAPATLFWVEAQDGGDPEFDTDIRDKVFLLCEPFNTDPTLLVELSQRFDCIFWGNDNTAIIYETWGDTRNVKSWLINPADPGNKKMLLFNFSWEDVYNDPGAPVMICNEFGRHVLKIENKKEIFLQGYGASPEGVFPFLDKLDIQTEETTRLWQCKAPFYEYFVSFIDNRSFITSQESKTEPRNYYLRYFNEDSLKQLTYFPHPAPKLIDIQKELIHYEREDGVKLTGTLYLPAGYSPMRDGTLPMIMWAYPTEFKSASSAGQIRESSYRFTRISWWSPLLWLTCGYAFLDNPGMPIIGEGDIDPNDTYIEQLIMNAEAAVNEVVKRGVADRNRIAIGGHSYGAFMAANVLTHSDLFCAGIARSGAYNRTLTPFGFQSEKRTLWEASDVYYAMSPFLHADKIDYPILLIHGEVDNNSGTYPIQSERYYNALKGLGKTARLVLLPHESHSYRARESIMHVLWEMETWLDRYVK